jgi:Cu+-exporting ATPase
MKRLAFLVLLLASAACGGAAPSAPPPATPAPAGASALKAPGEAKVGDRTRCPVSGDEFVVTADSPQTDFGGKTYYFCCAGCINKFKADPQKFIAKPGA